MASLNSLQSSIGEIQITLKSLVKQLNVRFKRIDQQFDEVRSETKNLRQEMNRRFDEQDSRFENWKSELFSKIDSSYLKPIKDLQDEDAAKQFQLEEHERKISKLEKTGFASA